MSQKSKYGIVDTEVKYRPKTLADFIFPSQDVKEVISAYCTGGVTRPLILCGSNGTGKSLLAQLLPPAIEGRPASVNRVRATDLNSSKEVNFVFTSDKEFDRLFRVDDQLFNYNVIEEVNFNPSARDAFRVVLDEVRGVDLTIITTNRIDKIDIGIRSRSEVVEVTPLEPELFLPRAKAIINAEGFEVDEAALLAALQATYDLGPDNRNYYKKVDSLLRSM